MSTLNEKLQKFMDELAIDAVEERVVDYVTRELANGRKLSEILKDPYVKNRLSEEKLAKVLENSEVMSALEEQISVSFQRKEFGFNE